MSDDKNYFSVYIQKFEQHHLEVLRKGIDAELKMMGLINAVKHAEAQYEESQKQVAIQNDMMEQAAALIKNISEEKDTAGEEIIAREKIISEKNTMINDLSDRLVQSENEKDIIIQQVIDLKKQIKDLDNEIKRQNNEMSLMIKEKKTK
ncbi:hypothetical protein UFOVP247_127 [uncultured Caudovirales phage]|uniref:Uncharacterized protein n=1 Tax=uncultured Caudovirales phage TaxID=2100421 RepID=A0A6J7WYY0_9CAUD|nr:hypothetical protein UFOVP247_127 [uncultured Caudovirales phage]